MCRFVAFYILCIMKAMKLLKGEKIANKILTNVERDIRKLKIRPSLEVILVGNNKASKIYIALKKKAAKKVGIVFRAHKFFQNSTEKEIIQKIRELNRNEKVSGIIVQLPLPKNFNTQKIINTIDPRKDADGFSAKNFLQPVFPKAILKLIEIKRKKLKNKKAVIITNSRKFGTAMRIALKKISKDSNYLVLKNKALQHPKILKQLKSADIIISAIGKSGLITGDMIKKGAIIIDGGIVKIGKKVRGDVDIKSVKNVASFITPVPGGVGPVTIACLLENVYILEKNKHKRLKN